ncbi:ankyrin repeat domain-containing protein 13D isoform X2 [Scaptodrosophila lebanonensis]|uniref:Ankyrin repeat domain-containing protein 13D isoform X2 n=1 Tax=Drosophila lebanonensis TaxID=7225 RepID=A0A6J2T4J3_DROLE|nr:ankyrin repeat domain-containing protein 13D isoform X2 [Scaptodrosophila lebanonensis]
MKSLDEIQTEYPLHWHIWNGNIEQLQSALQVAQIDKEKIDPRGRTPLMLAVRLGNLQCVKCLLAAKCNATYEHESWSIVQEAVCTGDIDILTAIIEVRDLQRHMQRVTHVPKLLQHLLDAPDFYIEMKWEFTSWVPLMSRLCPSDTYKVYKRGANVRIDTTLLGFDNNTWQRGNRSYIFKGSKETATMIEIDHDTHEVMVEQMNSEIGDIVAIPPPVGAVRARLNAPVITNTIEMEKISFERNKSGIWGWRSEKSELINGYNCKVYGASNVEFVTKTRMDHLSEEQIKNKTARTPLHSLLGISDEDYVPPTDAARERSPSPRPGDIAGATHGENNGRITPAVVESNGSSAGASGANTPSSMVITPEEYFSAEIQLHGRDVGKPKKLNTKVQRFKANLWLAEEHPIRLQEQVLPILDLMSTMASPHVSKLKDFITMQLPAGFPVKVEIPLFHVLNACITFGNVFAMTTPVEYVNTLQEDDRITCLVDDRCFDIPSHYVNRGGDARRQIPLDEDDMLQYAIEQSLAETSGAGGACGLDEDTDKVDIWEVLRGQHVVGSDLLPEDDEQLQRVLQESLLGAQAGGSPVSDDDDGGFRYVDPDLAMAMRLSQQDQQKYELELQREQEMIDQALKLSLQEH